MRVRVCARVFACVVVLAKLVLTTTKQTNKQEKLVYINDENGDNEAPKMLVVVFQEETKSSKWGRIQREGNYFCLVFFFFSVFDVLKPAIMNSAAATTAR